MNTTRRGFFGMLAGLAATPLFAPLVKLVPRANTYLSAYYNKEFIRNGYANTRLTSFMREPPSIVSNRKTRIPITFYTYPLKGPEA